MNVTGNISFNCSVIEAFVSGLASAQLEAALSSALSFANGTGAGNINKYWSKSSTPAGSTPDTWTLSALTDDAGRTIVLAKVRLLVVVNLDTVDGHDLALGGAGTHPWAAPFGSGTDKVKVLAGGFFVLPAPLATAYPVGSGSSDQLMVDPGTHSVPYKILIAGE